MFIGVHPHKLDEKGRMSIPTNFRSVSDGTYYITFSPDGCLWVYDEEGFNRYLAELEQLDEFDSQVRSLKRVFYSGPPPQKCDTHGRVKIPAQCMEYASLSKEVVLNGMKNYFEVWAKEKWDKVFGESLAGYDRNMRDQRKQQSR